MGETNFKKCFDKGNGVLLLSTSRIGITALALLFAIVFVILGAEEGRTSETWPLWWREHVRSLKVQGKDVKVMKSKNMKPEKSPEEFLKRYKKVREQAGKNFTFQTFVEDVARGLVIEQRYQETKGVFYNSKENLNPNYYWSGKRLVFNCDKFCINPELLRNTFGKEDSIGRYQTQKTETYGYISLGTDFNVDFIPGINKKCASKARFDSDFFYRMENRKGRG